MGVARQYSGTLGKTANCQVAVSLHQTGTEESVILGWRLDLPESWTEDPQRRAAAGIPAEVKFLSKWQLALELIDEARGWGLRCGVVLGDAGYGESIAYRYRELPGAHDWRLWDRELETVLAFQADAIWPSPKGNP